MPNKESHGNGDSRKVDQPVEPSVPSDTTQSPDQYQPGMKAMMRSPFMARLTMDIQKGVDVGHYGRLTFAIISRYFLEKAEIVEILQKQENLNEVQALGLLVQVMENDYSPPDREKLQAWSNKQDYALVTNADPDIASIYRHLSFPDHVYARIRGYYEGKASAMLQEMKQEKKNKQ